MVITINYFIQFIRKATLMFRDSAGVFYYDRWKPLFEGIANAVFSILLVKTTGVTGVIVATIFTNLLICDIIEPYVLFRYGFGSSVKRYYAMNYIYIALFIATLFGMKYLSVHHDNLWLDLFVNGCIAVAVSVIPTGFMMMTNKDFRTIAKSCLSRLRRRLFKRMSH